MKPRIFLALLALCLAAGVSAQSVSFEREEQPNTKLILSHKYTQAQILAILGSPMISKIGYEDDALGGICSKFIYSDVSFILVDDALADFIVKSSSVIVTVARDGQAPVQVRVTDDVRSFYTKISKVLGQGTRRGNVLYLPFPPTEDSLVVKYDPQNMKITAIHWVTPV